MLRRFLYRLIDHILTLLCEDDTEIMYYHICEAAQISEAILFTQGETLEVITVVPDEENGYHINIQPKEEVGANNA